MALRIIGYVGNWAVGENYDVDAITNGRLVAVKLKDIGKQTPRYIILRATAGAEWRPCPNIYSGCALPNRDTLDDMKRLVDLFNPSDLGPRPKEE